MNTPKELKFTKEHEWIKELEGGAVQIGITDFAQDALGDIVYVGLPEAGDTVEAGGTLGDVESVKAVSDVYCPVSGTVREINETLLDSPQLINQTPYEAWIAVVENITETVETMDADSYEAFCAE